MRQVPVAAFVAALLLTPYLARAKPLLPYFGKNQSATTTSTGRNSTRPTTSRFTTTH